MLWGYKTNEEKKKNNPGMVLPLPSKLFPWQHEVLLMRLLLDCPSLP